MTIADWIQLGFTAIITFGGAYFAWWFPRNSGRRLAEREEQEKILRQILISKTQIDLDEYVRCLSYIELAFANHKGVLDAWRLLNRAYNTPRENSNYQEEKRDNLIREIGKVLGYSDEAISQLLGREVYRPVWLQRQQEVDLLDVKKKHEAYSEAQNKSEEQDLKD